MKIEAKLLGQIPTFVGAPKLSDDERKAVEKAIDESYMKDSFRCPISGKPILYNEFSERVGAPVHGRSGYQVGHLNPLATTGAHISLNTSWITDLGNRVQGDESREKITNEIFYMAKFHKDRLGISWQQAESMADSSSN